MSDLAGLKSQLEAESVQSGNSSETPKVSVVIPTYNGERWIRDAIDSVLNQSMNDFEIIVCDDASTDHTVSVAREYMSDRRLHVHDFNENLGLGGNWNRGLKLARGTYLKVLCQDDVLLDGCLETSVSVFERHPSVTLVTSYGSVFGDENRNRDQSVLPVKGEVTGRDAQCLVIEKENWIGAPTAVMMRQNDLHRIGYFDQSLSCSLDWEMWMRLLSIGNLYVHTGLLHATRSHGGKESMRCMQNLGFEKDRVTILNRLRNGDSRYGEWTRSELQNAWIRAIRSLFRASINRKSVPISSIFTFLSQYQSGLQTAGMYIRLVSRDFFNRLMTQDKSNKPRPLNS